MNLDEWLPKSIVSLRGYDARAFMADLLAGITVGLVALPLAMAFAISSGVPPQAGLYCAVVAGFVISALGGSRHQIGGPTGAFVVVVAGIVAHHGIDGLFMCTMMAGVMLILLGVTRLGSAVDLIPRPVIVGFTGGIALLIASTQFKDFLGLPIAQTSSMFLPRMGQIVSHLGLFSPAAAGLSVGSLVLLLLWNRWVPRVPGTIVALVLGTVVVAVFRIPVETIGSRFGGIPVGFPAPAIPTFRADLLYPLLTPALTVAMLGAIESLMSAVVADRMTGDRHNPNVELIAQGIANVASPLFGGLPATGAIARTATNIRSGARTPIAGMIHAVTLLCVLLFAAPLARFIPLPVLASILLVVAYNMGVWHEIPELMKLSKTDVSVWAVTFLLTVFADLTAAVQAGMILAALLTIRRVAATTTVAEVTGIEIESDRVHVLHDRSIPDYATVFRIQGPFLFGAAEKVEPIIDRIATLPPVVILRVRNMTAIDATGLSALEDLMDRVRASGRTMLVCGASEQPARYMIRSGFVERLGRENFCANIQEALDRAKVAGGGA